MAKTWVLVAAILGSSMAFVDATAVNVSLPIVQRDLQATGPQMQWVIEAYALFLSALILIGGSLGDVYGRRAMFVAGVVLFALASAACALAPNVDVLIAARAIHGIGGALATPESLALISANFSGEERGRAIGSWSGFASITGAAGPVIGGALAQHASWRWVFLINLPVAFAVIFIALTRVPESREAGASHALDWTGATLATLGLGALVYGLIEVQAVPNAAGFATIAAGIGVLTIFGLHQRRARHPMLPPSLFASRTFVVVNLYTLVLYTALGGSLYFLPYALIDAQGYAPTAAGAALLPFIALQFGLSRWSGGLSARIGVRTPLVVGALLVAIGFALFALPGIGGNYWTTYFPAALVLGVGGAFFIAPLTTAVFDSSDPALAGTASAVNNAVARTAGLLAIALFGIVLASAFGRSFDGALDHLDVDATTRTIAHHERAAFLGGSVPASIVARDRATIAPVQRASFLDGFRAVMWWSAATCVGAALLAFVGLPRSAIASAQRGAKLSA
jgi:EmrB/QacA subfamily drug resistance transporter